jgi:hypothetical protein
MLISRNINSMYSSNHAQKLAAFNNFDAEVLGDFHFPSSLSLSSSLG